MVREYNCEESHFSLTGLIDRWCYKSAAISFAGLSIYDCKSFFCLCVWIIGSARRLWRSLKGLWGKAKDGDCMHSKS